MQKSLLKTLTLGLAFPLALAAGCKVPRGPQTDGGSAILAANADGGGRFGKVENGFMIGHATNFDGVADRGGGCGTPPDLIDQESGGRFIALNVQDTRGNYQDMLPRPNTTGKGVGAWNNGKNCGRWVRVVLDDDCRGQNDGVAGQGFCRGGQGYQADSNNGAEQYFLVVDSCQDPNAWCRDDPFHIDISARGIRQFKKNGQTVNISAWTNRLVRWQFIKAPSYSGDLKIGFVEGNFYTVSQGAWLSVIIANLENGISKVEASAAGSGQWQQLKMVGDNGLKFENVPASPSKTWDLRVYDYDGQLIARGGKSVYRFGFPCDGRCPKLFNPVTYTKI